MEGYLENQEEMSDETLDDFILDIKSHLVRYGWYLDWLEKYLKEDYRYLDLGCRNGEFLVQLRERIDAWKLYGVELHEDSAMIASDRGIAVYTQDVHYLKLENDFFDFVFLTHLLEHTHNPSKVLWQVEKVTKPGGCVFIEVPLEPKPKKLPTEWAHWYTFQRPRSLLTLIDSEVFKIIKRKIDPKRKWYRLLLRKRER